MIFWKGSSRSCFIYGSVFQVIGEKTLCSKDFTRNLRDFYMKIILTIIPAILVTSLIFCPFIETKNNN